MPPPPFPLEGAVRMRGPIPPPPFPPRECGDPSSPPLVINQHPQGLPYRSLSPPFPLYGGRLGWGCRPIPSPTPSHCPRACGDPSPPSHMSFRTQRSEVEESRCHPTLPHPLSSRRDLAPVKTGGGDFPHVIPNAAKRSRGISLPSALPSPRRGGSRTSRFPTPRHAYPSPSVAAGVLPHPLFPRMREPIPPPPFPLYGGRLGWGCRPIPSPLPHPLSSRMRGPIPPLSTCHSERSAAKSRNLAAIPPSPTRCPRVEILPP